MRDLIKAFGKLIEKTAFIFVSSIFLYWGWTTLAPHLNAPLFTFWEIFAMRMALSHIMRILWQKTNDPVETVKTKEEED